MSAGLFAELKRRKVFKVGAAYLVVAWLAVQAASIGFPAFDVPPWALSIFILVALLGFPAAAMLGWVFDSPPTGVVLLGSRAAQKIPLHETRKRTVTNGRHGSKRSFDVSQ